MRTKFLGVAWVAVFVGAGGWGVACGGGVQATPLGTDAGSEAGDARAPGDARPPIGSEAGDGSCRSNGDCPVTGQGDMMSYCSGPYDWTGCMPGCMPQVVCATDSQCDASTVCRQSSVPIGCGQTQGLSYCSPPCQADGDCPPTQTCSTGHCQPRPCSSCPAYFSCTNGVCAPKACTSDTECPTGYCVNGSCVGTLGVCMAMVGCG